MRSGDTLAEIAQRHRVRGGWQALYEANRVAIGPSPDALRSGMLLALPPSGPAPSVPSGPAPTPPGPSPSASPVPAPTGPAPIAPAPGQSPPPPAAAARPAPPA
nr:LysM peptidoglycan-binding domain-containing protein [Streptomyces sp. NBC_00974]